jgi:hypothetical protein
MDEQGERIEGWADADDLDVADVAIFDRDYVKVWWGKPATLASVPATLILRGPTTEDDTP